MTESAGAGGEGDGADERQRVGGGEPAEPLIEGGGVEDPGERLGRGRLRPRLPTRFQLPQPSAVPRQYQRRTGAERMSTLPKPW